MPTGLIEKLQIKPGMNLVLINPPQDLQQWLKTQLTGVAIASDLSSRPEAALAFVRTKAEVLTLAPEIFKSIKAGALVWLVYPKGGSGIPTNLNRDILWEVLKPSGWRPVRNVAVDDNWSAIRFRPVELVGK